MAGMRPFLLLGLLLPAAGATAQPVRATYEVHAAGMTMMQFEAVLDLAGESYRMETVMRARGLLAAIIPGEQVTRVAGAWVGGTPAPAFYRSEGTWRGRPRRILLEWQGGEPRLVELSPPNEEEREPVPDAMRRGTMDALSAMALLARQVAEARSCDGIAPVYDGRRRSEFLGATRGWERVPVWRGGWTGTALRCDFEGRLVAGFRVDQDRAQAAEPQRGTAWIAAPYEGAPPIPVRIDMPTRWFGTAVALLVRAEPAPAR